MTSRADSTAAAGDSTGPDAHGPVSQLTVRAADFGDFTHVRRLFKALHDYNASLDPRFALSEHWEEQLYTAFTDGQGARDQLWILAWVEDRPVGFLWGKLHRDQPTFHYREWTELVAIYVDSETRASGVGHALIDRLREWTRALGHDSIQAFVTASNEPAMQFYAREGFVHSQSIVRLILPR